MSQEQGIYIVGTSGFACEVTEYIESSDKFRVNGYFGKSELEYKRYGFNAPFLGSEDDYYFNYGDKVIVAIANSEIRKKVTSFLAEKGCEFPSFCSPLAFVGRRAEIGNGSILCPYVIITSNAKIGLNFQANIYSYVAHDCIFGDNVTFAPGVKCNGNVEIGDNVYVGTNAVIFQGKMDKPLVIGSGAVIAAGSVVTKSVPANMTVFGNPAIEFNRENIKRRS
jgi:sugar O-acyltransferase (sialic acid O-acetyltransferase NeuD family)